MKINHADHGTWWSWMENYWNKVKRLGAPSLVSEGPRSELSSVLFHLLSPRRSRWSWDISLRYKSDMNLEVCYQCLDVLLEKVLHEICIRDKDQLSLEVLATRTPDANCNECFYLFRRALHTPLRWWNHTSARRCKWQGLGGGGFERILFGTSIRTSRTQLVWLGHYRVCATPSSAWKALEFNFGLRGTWKALEKNDFVGNCLKTPWISLGWKLWRLHHAKRKWRSR